MDRNLIYMPTFRLRQEEIKVLKTTDFGDNIYPLLEIVKEKARKDSDKTFSETYNSIIDDINSNHVFVDLPNYLSYSNNVTREIIEFGLRVCRDQKVRNEYILELENKDKIIPVISSFEHLNSNTKSIKQQYKIIKPYFNKIAFRLFADSFFNDINKVLEIITENDYLIVDIGKQMPFSTISLKPIIDCLKNINLPTKVLLRSAINTDVQNVDFVNNEIIDKIDNSHLENEVLTKFEVNCFGDYAGVKKDLMTKGGTVSPGFIYFDAVQNQSYGFKSEIKNLDQFKNEIVPNILSSKSTKRMLNFEPPYLNMDNLGYKILYNIMYGSENGRNQAKFKKIAMDHYIYCIKNKIEIGEISQVNI